ncbi:uncharacterized protein LOC108165425 [Drosophila miranda]|uniref:uncharacterized protein LOC108165425 n=1 Tax=Drosophila miranda TaxID=7229 RepID=UPI0007E67FB8|nr:uncharacterized protein LOC108165425 [Drosophila miranda]
MALEKKITEVKKQILSATSLKETFVRKPLSHQQKKGSTNRTTFNHQTFQSAPGSRLTSDWFIECRRRPSSKDGYPEVISVNVKREQQKIYRRGAANRKYPTEWKKC